MTTLICATGVSSLEALIGNIGDERSQPVLPRDDPGDIEPAALTCRVGCDSMPADCVRGLVRHAIAPDCSCDGPCV